MSDSSKKPVVLLSIDGLGLSTSWKGNALLSAKMDNFNRLWNNYQHFALSPVSKQLSASSFYEHPDLSYTLMMTGEMSAQKTSIIKDALADKSFYAASAILAAFDNTTRHSSTLHLINCFSLDKDLFEVEAFSALIQAAKSNGTHNILVHLFLDDSWHDKEELSNKLVALEEKMAVLGVDSVATLGGIDKVSQLISPKLIGKKFYSLWAAVAKYRGSKFSQLPFQTKAEIPRNIVNNFDSIIFTSPDIPEAFSNLIFSLSSNSAVTIRFAPLFSLFKMPEQRGYKITPILSRQSKKSLLHLLDKAGKKAHLISEEKVVMSVFNNVLLDENPSDSVYIGDANRSTEEITGKFFDQVLTDIKSSKYDFVFARLASLAQMTNFDQSVRAIRRLDNFLAAFEKSIIDSDGRGIITSGFGGLEQLNHTDHSNNLLPLIVVSKDKKVQTGDSLIGNLRQNLDHSETYRILVESIGI